jgi:hypothetical protein
VAAIAAICAVVVGLATLSLQLWWRRPVLSVTFEGHSWQSERAFVLYDLAVTNDGPVTVHDLTTVAHVGNREIASTAASGVTLAPKAAFVFGFAVETAILDSLGVTENPASIDARLTAEIRYGRRRRTVAYGERKTLD